MKNALEMEFDSSEQQIANDKKKKTSVENIS